MKNANSLKNKGYNLIGSNLSVQKVDENSEKIIEDLMLECNKWNKDYMIMHNENNVLKKYISKLEKNIGIEEQMNNMRALLVEKDQTMVKLLNQIKEYQSKVDDIILGKSEESKDKQIQMLLNEVKVIRKRFLNMTTLNNRITNFEEFIEAINTIKQLEMNNKDKNISDAFDKLAYLIDIYQQNNDNAYSQFVNEIYNEGKNVNNLINFEEFGKKKDDENNDINDNNGGNNNFNNDLGNNNINNIYDNIDLDHINTINQNNLDNGNSNINNNYNKNKSENMGNINTENRNDDNNDIKEKNNDKEDFFNTNIENNKESDYNNNDINFNTKEDEENNNKIIDEDKNGDEDNKIINFNENEDNENGNNNYNEDNNFDNAFDDINFDGLENEDLDKEPNEEKNNNIQNDDQNNNDDDEIL